MRRWMYLMVAGLLFALPAAQAETIRGLIVNLNPATDMLSVRRTDAVKNKAQQLDIKVKTDTKTKNVASLKELKVGHEVKIDAKEDKASGVYEAKSIEVTGTQAVEAPGAAASSGAAASVSASTDASQGAGQASRY